LHRTQNTYTVLQKGDTKLKAVTVNSEPIFKNFSLSDFPVNLQHPLCLAAPPCETLMSENERQSQTNVVINDTLQGTVVTYLRCSGIINNQIKKRLLLSLPVKRVWIFGLVTGKRWIVSCTFLTFGSVVSTAQSARDNFTFLLLTLPTIFTSRFSNKSFLIWLLTTHHTLNMLLHCLVICRQCNEFVVQLIVQRNSNK